MPSADPIEVEKFSRIAEEWWDPHGKFRPLHRINPLRVGYIRDKIIEHFGQIAGITLLDIGCGGGLVCEPFTRLGAKATGIDASGKNIGVARAHAAQSGLDINYQCTTAENLSGDTYDVVLALEIIEHVPDPAAFAAACAGLAKPGGLLIFSTLNRTAKAFALAIVGAEYVLRWLPRGTHDWERFIRPSELAGWLRQSDCEVKELTGLVMHPLTFQWSLTPKDLSVNYLLVAMKA